MCSDCRLRTRGSCPHCCIRYSDIVEREDRVPSQASERTIQGVGAMPRCLPQGHREPVAAGRAGSVQGGSSTDGHALQTHADEPQCVLPLHWATEVFDPMSTIRDLVQVRVRSIPWGRVTRVTVSSII